MLEDLQLLDQRRALISQDADPVDEIALMRVPNTDGGAETSVMQESRSKPRS